jgi:hypothetical protein
VRFEMHKHFKLIATPASEKELSSVCFKLLIRR